MPNNGNNRRVSDFENFINDINEELDDSNDSKNKKDKGSNEIYKIFKLFVIGMFLLGPFAMLGLFAIGMLALGGKKIYDHVKGRNKTPNEITKEAAKAYKEEAPENDKKEDFVQQILSLSKDEQGKELSEEAFQKKLAGLAVKFSKSEKGKKALGNEKVKQLFQNVFKKDIDEVIKDAQKIVNEKPKKEEIKEEIDNKEDKNKETKEEIHNKKEDKEGKDIGQNKGEGEIDNKEDINKNNNKEDIKKGEEDKNKEDIDNKKEDLKKGEEDKDKNKEEVKTEENINKDTNKKEDKEGKDKEQPTIVDESKKLEASPQSTTQSSGESSGSSGNDSNNNNSNNNNNNSNNNNNNDSGNKDEGVSSDQIYNLFKLLTIGMFLLGPGLMLGAVAAGLLIISGKKIYDHFSSKSEDNNLSPQEQLEAAAKGIKDASKDIGIEKAETNKLLNELLSLNLGPKGKLEKKDYYDKLIDTVSKFGDSVEGKNLLKDKEVNQLFSEIYGEDLALTAKHAKNHKNIVSKYEKNVEKNNERSKKIEDREKELSKKGKDFFKKKVTSDDPSKKMSGAEYSNKVIELIHNDSAEKVKNISAKMTHEDYRKTLMEIAGNHKAFEKLSGVGPNGQKRSLSLTLQEMTNVAKIYHDVNDISPNSKEYKEIQEIYNNAKISDSSYLKGNMDGKELNNFQKEEDKIQKEKESIAVDKEKNVRTYNEDLEKENKRHNTEVEEKKKADQERKEKEEIKLEKLKEAEKLKKEKEAEKLKKQQEKEAKEKAEKLKEANELEGDIDIKEEINLPDSISEFSNNKSKSNDKDIELNNEELNNENKGFINDLFSINDDGEIESNDYRNFINLDDSESLDNVNNGSNENKIGDNKGPVEYKKNEFAEFNPIAKKEEIAQQLSERNQNITRENELEENERDISNNKNK